MKEKYVVDGYSFSTESEAKAARNEIEGIEYLKKRMNLKNPGSVLDIYDKAIEKNLFKTPIGYSFLRELQQFLLNSPDISPDDVRDIPVLSVSGKKDKKLKEKRVSIIPKDGEKKYKSRITNLVILNIFLVIAIVIIIIITNNSSNINILNYKERIDREYEKKEDEMAGWAQELREREEELDRLLQ
ncbi:MAG: hypothetical protein ACLRVQ_08890 [Lachnospiraceae bacterium]